MFDSSYGADPISVLGDELRERGLGGEDTEEGMVMTQEAVQNLALVAPWLKAREPFVLVSVWLHPGWSTHAIAFVACTRFRAYFVMYVWTCKVGHTCEYEGSSRLAGRCVPVHVPPDNARLHLSSHMRN